MSFPSIDSPYGISSASQPSICILVCCAQHLEACLHRYPEELDRPAWYDVQLSFHLVNAARYSQSTFPTSSSLEQKYSGAVTIFRDLRSRRPLSVEHDWEQDVRLAVSHAPLQPSHAHPRDRVLMWMGKLIVRTHRDRSAMWSRG